MLTKTELAYAAADMLADLRDDLTAELRDETRPKEREHLEYLLKHIPTCMYILGTAAGKASMKVASSLSRARFPGAEEH
jgi:ribonuclease D